MPHAAQRHERGVDDQILVVDAGLDVNHVTGLGHGERLADGVEGVGLGASASGALCFVDPEHRTSRRRAGLAAVHPVAIDVPSARLAVLLPTGPSDAGRVLVEAARRADHTTAAAVVGVGVEGCRFGVINGSIAVVVEPVAELEAAVAQLTLAAVGGHRVEVDEGVVAARQLADSADAGRGAVGQSTHRAAAATVPKIRIEVHTAPVALRRARAALRHAGARLADLGVGEAVHVGDATVRA